MADVVNTASVVPVAPVALKFKEGVVAPLKLMVPAPVTAIVPEPLGIAIELPKVSVPVVAEITSVATRAVVG